MRKDGGDLWEVINQVFFFHFFSGVEGRKRNVFVLGLFFFFGGGAYFFLFG